MDYANLRTRRSKRFVEFVQIFSFITSVNVKSTETVLKFNLHLSEKLFYFQSGSICIKTSNKKNTLIMFISSNK